MQMNRSTLSVMNQINTIHIQRGDQGIENKNKEHFTQPTEFETTLVTIIQKFSSKITTHNE